jgi:hypothetical protein
MTETKKRSSRISFLAGTILEKLGKFSCKPTRADLEKIEFKTSTQRLGIRFTEKVRKIFRPRWLKKK